MSDTNSSSSRRPSLMSEHGPENQFISVENPVIALCSKAKFDWDSNLHLQLIPESNLDLHYRAFITQMPSKLLTIRQGSGLQTSIQTKWFCHEN